MAFSLLDESIATADALRVKQVHTQQDCMYLIVDLECEFRRAHFPLLLPSSFSFRKLCVCVVVVGGGGIL